MDRDIEQSALSIAIEALKMSSSNQAVINQHLTECRDRFVNLRNVTLAGFTLLITTLLSVLGYLLTHSSIGVH
jgi:hypothetical protein